MSNNSPNTPREPRPGLLAIALALVAALGCGSGTGPGLHGQGGRGGHAGQGDVDGSTDGSTDRSQPPGTGGIRSDGGAGAAGGGAGAAGGGAGGGGGSAGSAGNRPDGAAADAGLDATRPQDAAAGSGGAAGAAGNRGAAGRGAGGGSGAAGAGARGGNGGSGGGPDAGPPCDPVAQTGCPAGDKCGIPPACIPAGTVSEGRICAVSGFDDCASPDICIGDGTSHLCRQACNLGADCRQAATAAGTTAEPNNLGRCLISLGGSTTKVCTFACNPVTAAGASGCPTGYACDYFQTTPVPEVTDCEPAGAVAENGDCTTVGCAPGLVCVSSGSTNRCRQICRSGNNADCGVAGDTCLIPTGVTSPMFGFCCAAAGC